MSDKIHGFKATYAVTTEELMTLQYAPDEMFTRIVKEKLIKDLVQQLEQHLDKLPIVYGRDEKGMYVEYSATLYFADKRED